MVGTSVRDRMNDQIIANITASAIGTNRKRDTPVRKNIGTNTMQMQSSETKAGVTICAGAVENGRLDLLALLQMPVDVLDRHRGVVDQDADREREAAERHDVEGLADRRQHRDRSPSTDSGIDTAMMMVERQLPRNSRIITLVSSAAMTAFVGDALDRAAHEDRLVADQADLERLRQRILDLDRSSS